MMWSHYTNLCIMSSLNWVTGFFSNITTPQPHPTPKNGQINIHHQGQNQYTTRRFHAHTPIKQNTRRNAYYAVFRIKVIKLAVKLGNRATARKFDINCETLEEAAGRTESD